MTQTPTDALRLVPRRAVFDWLRDDVPLNVKMTVMPHHVDALLDRLSKAAPVSPLPEGGGWQDISTAPKDGTAVLFLAVPDAMHKDPRDGVGGFSMWSGSPILWDWGWVTPPTHWMPLPVAPTGDA